MSEPILTDEDIDRWDAYVEAALDWSRTSKHRRRVDKARAWVLEMAAQRPQAYVAWSAGKDSTALVHLVCVECGVPARAMSIKDDCDYPGEVEYVEGLAAQWGVGLDLLRPPFSLQQWVIDHRDGLDAFSDLHSRASALSDAAFYSLIETHRRSLGLPGVYLGLRKDESNYRLRNRTKHGPIYTKKDGETVCQPLCDWAGIDVYAYLLGRDIEPLHVYRCIGLESDPSRLRKSWWLMGRHAAHGNTVWLRRYYPSLYRRLCELLPEMATMA